ncbi:recombination protein RecR [Candidatus Roizmanbacteria bacterium]|nr:recombination protein RecR [Candidatus Roizmanbacteria bacterium]
MATLPASLRQIALFFERLPGIGEKTANRLAFYLLRLPDQDLQDFARHIQQLKARTKRCSDCLNLTEDDVCSICSDNKRDHGVITVVEDVIDLLSFETGNIYEGVYHVLHGRIDPLNHIGPEDIFIDKLLSRVKEKGANLKEIILATNPDMEGEATAMYLRDRLNEIKNESGAAFNVTRLGYGLPIGANLEYADYMTLRKAIENRNKF